MIRPSATAPAVLFLGSDLFSIRIFRAIKSALPSSDVFVVTPSPVKYGRGGRETYVSPLAAMIEDYRNGWALQGQAGLRGVRGMLHVDRQDKKMQLFQLPEELAAVRNKILITASFGHMIPTRIMREFPTCMNVHPSLLPDYRGAAPVPRTIINGDKVSGATIQIMSENAMDRGLILKQDSIQLSGSETTPSLLDTLAGVSAKILSEVLGDLNSHKSNAIEQTEVPPPDWNPWGNGHHPAAWRRANKLKRQISHISLSDQTASEIERIDRAVRHVWPITCRTPSDRTLQLFLDKTMPAVNPALFTLEPGHIRRIPPNTLHQQGDLETIAVGTKSGALHVTHVKDERHNTPIPVHQWQLPADTARYIMDY